MSTHKEVDKKLKKIKKLVGRLDTKAPKIIVPKKVYQRKEKYKIDWQYVD